MTGHRPRYLTLDTLRGVAALMVVITHVFPLTWPNCTDTTCNVRFGYLAVDLFFALSGFVIAMNYEPRFALGLNAVRFMLLRFIRLFPLFWIAAALGAIPLIYAASIGQEPWVNVLLISITNAVLAPSPPLIGHPDPFPLVSPAWSLFYELWVANLSFAVIGRRLSYKLLVSIIVASFAGLTLYVTRFGTIDGGSLWSTFIAGLPRVMFSFFVGVLLHRTHKIFSPPQIPSIVILTVFALTLVMDIPERFSAIYELGCVAVFYPALIYLGAGATEKNPRIGAILGDAS